MIRTSPRAPHRSAEKTIPSAGRASRAIAAASVLALLALNPAVAQEKRSSLSNPGAPSASAATDTPKDETIKKVAQLIDGMGYTVKSSGADYIVLDANGFFVAIEPAGDGSAIYASVYYQVPKEKRTMMPAEKILEYNGHSSDYFGTSKAANDQISIALMNHLSAAQLSPRNLKDIVDQVTTDARQHLELLDPSAWKSGLPDFTSK